MTAPGPARLGPEVLTRLREHLRRSRYTVDDVASLLGHRAHQALARDETTAALRVTRDAGGPTSVLVRLWLLQVPVSRVGLDRALPGLVEPLAAAGLVALSGDEVRSLVDIRPYADDSGHEWYVASDLTRGLDGGARVMAPDAVIGPSGASTSLARLTVPVTVDRALDLGTGCGVQALHLSTHARSVVATDVSPRSLALAALTAGLSGVDLDLRHGSLFEPVQGETFDLVVSNPPFVISPGTGARLVYRDSGLPGDEMVRRVVTGGAARLAPDGWCQVLGNWVHQAGVDWADRVGGWLDGLGCDAWVVQREVLDPAGYVELWLNDAGLRGSPGYRDRYDRWLAWFDDSGVESVGLGWVTLRRTDRVDPDVRLEEWPHPMEDPIGPTVARWGERAQASARLSDGDLLGSRLLQAPGLVEERTGEPGAADPQRIVLRQTHGMLRARAVSTAVAGFVGACDGELTVAQISDALASLLDQEESALRDQLLAEARALLRDAYLHG